MDKSGAGGAVVCLICLKRAVSSSSQKPMPKRVRWVDGAGNGFPANSPEFLLQFTRFCKSYLKIGKDVVDQVFNPVPAGKRVEGGHTEEGEKGRPFCEECHNSIDRLVKAYNELRRLEGNIVWKVKQLVDVMAERDLSVSSGTNCGLLEALQKSLYLNEKDVLLTFRDQMKKKCTTKTLHIMPAVVLHRCKTTLQCKSEPGVITKTDMGSRQVQSVPPYIPPTDLDLHDEEDYAQDPDWDPIMDDDDDISTYADDIDPLQIGPEEIQNLEPRRTNSAATTTQRKSTDIYRKADIKGHITTFRTDENDVNSLQSMTDIANRLFKRREKIEQKMKMRRLVTRPEVSPIPIFNKADTEDTTTDNRCNDDISKPETDGEPDPLQIEPEKKKRKVIRKIARKVKMRRTKKHTMKKKIINNPDKKHIKIPESSMKTDADDVVKIGTLENSVTGGKVEIDTLVNSVTAEKVEIDTLVDSVIEEKVETDTLVDSLIKEKVEVDIGISRRCRNSTPKYVDSPTSDVSDDNDDEFKPEDDEVDFGKTVVTKTKVRRRRRSIDDCSNVIRKRSVGRPRGKRRRPKLFDESGNVIRRPRGRPKSLKKQIQELKQPETPGQCNHCYKIFGLDFDLKQHKAASGHYDKCSFNRLAKMHPHVTYCEQCATSYEDVLAFYDHIATFHDKKDLLICRICQLSVANCQELRLHIHETHENPEEKTVFCRYCPTAFTTHQLRDLHSRFHHLMSPTTWFCGEPECSREFSTAPELNSHLISDHNKDNVFECDKCGWGFSTNALLKLHQFNHLAAGSDGHYFCDICSRTFTVLHFLVNHYNTRHSKKDKTQLFYCKICKSFYGLSQKELNFHITESHRDFEKTRMCGYCRKRIPGGLAELRKHKAKDHPGLHQGGKKSVLNKKCTYCQKEFRRQIDVLLHYRDMHREDHLKLHGTLFPRKYQCHKCGKHYTSRNHLERHVDNTHNEYNIVCEYDGCTKKFKSLHYRMEHVERMHLQQTVVCEFCAMTFSTDELLRRHMRRVHDKLHKCDKCVRTFLSPKHLSEHLLMHTTFKLSCEWCDQHFPYTKFKNEHVREKHPEHRPEEAVQAINK